MQHYFRLPPCARNKGGLVQSEKQRKGVRHESEQYDKEEMGISPGVIHAISCMRVASFLCQHNFLTHDTHKYRDHS